MKIRIVIAFFLFILAVSCASKKNPFLEPKVSNSIAHAGLVYDDTIELEISFIGIIDDRYVFETVVTNLSPYDITVDRSQFVMRNTGDIVRHSDDIQTTLQEVQDDQKKLVKRKKLNNWLAGIGVGISLLSGVSAGTSAGTALISSVEPTLYIMDENIWISKDIKSSEDYISYLQTAQYDYDVIPSGASMIKDIFFNVFEVNQDVEVEFWLEGLIYGVAFPKTAFLDRSTLRND
ncbi:MAG: hypothetical protein ACI9FN_002125 [Saprospiraceae bacterium]|jgi:hypothetical protein